MSAILKVSARNTASRVFTAQWRPLSKPGIPGSYNVLICKDKSSLPACSAGDDQKRFFHHSSRSTQNFNTHSKTIQRLLLAEDRNHFNFNSNLLSTSALQNFLPSARSFHSSRVFYESKVEETLEALKETIKKDDQSKIAAKKPAQSPTAPEEFPRHISTAWGPAQASNVKVNLVPSAEPVYASQIVVKLPLRTRVLNEIKHYIHGFRLLFTDVRVSVKLLWAVLNGKTLMRRERQQLVRTTADLFRLVPFMVIILVPFMEFLLPVLLKFFPGMLPSTFQEKDKEVEKRRKGLKLKLEMAKFLQDTIEETALQRKDGKGESVQEFVEFMNKIRMSGVQTSNEEILKFSKLFEDAITLDNLSPAQLRAMCKLLEITPVGPSYVLRFQLQMKLRDLEADDKMIQKEGTDSLAVFELQDACRQRGMRSFGVPEERLKIQLNQWLDLHLNMRIPTSLLLLSRTLYFPEHISTEDQLKATILALPQALAEEAKVKISEVSGDRVDNKSKLEVIKQEEELIMQEKLELEQAALRAKAEAELDLNKQPAASEKVLVHLDHIDETDKPDKIHTKDLEHLEDALDMVVESKQKLKAEVEDLKNLKEEFTEYKENIDQLKVLASSAETEVPIAKLEESKAAKRLSKKVEKMISKLDATVEKLSVETSSREPVAVPDDSSAPSPGSGLAAVGRTDNIPDLSAKELASLITITELLSALEKLKSDADSVSKYEIIAKVLDEDHDGLIDYNEAVRFVEILGKENLKIDKEQMADVVQLLKKEKKLLEGEKLKKQQEQQVPYHVPNIPDEPISMSGVVKQSAASASAADTKTDSRQAK